MNVENHARIKTIFFHAIDLPEGERPSFIEKECAGDGLIEREVRSLLAHHDKKTLLPMAERNVKGSDTDATASLLGASLQKKLAEGPHEKQLVLTELWNENRELLQSRLRIFATILGLVIGYSTIRKALDATLTWPFSSHVACLSIDLTCLLFLAGRRKTSLKQMRLLEVIITANVSVFLIVTDLHEMRVLSLEGSDVTIKSAALWNHFCWSLFILTYGVFIPNTWQRAACLLLPIAVIPYAVDSTTRYLHPVVAESLEGDKFGLPLPLSFIAAGIAISAARVIHGGRLAAFRLRRLVQYELVREIGRGGMGSVYEARHVMLERRCAIKIIQPEWSQDRNRLVDFEREVRATCGLTHPNTIEVYDFGQTNEGLFFYVMELLPGANLRDLVADSGPLPASRAIHFLVQICGALEEAHSHGLIHRDIKPANIFASACGGILDFAKLLDFGLVRQTKVPLGSDNRPGRYTAGTPAYMSPEQIVDYHQVDARSDIYSLGAVAYFLLVGQPPFQAQNDLEVLVAQAREPVVPPRSLKPEIGAELNDIVLKCLEKSAEDRFASARELKEALAACPLAQAWSQEQAAQYWQSRMLGGAAPT